MNSDGRIGDMAISEAIGTLHERRFSASAKAAIA